MLDVPYSQLRSVTFLDPKTSFDVMWRPAQVVAASGGTFMFKVPAFYVGTGTAQDGMVRTGQVTTWERDHGYAEAIGQRDFKATMADGGVSTIGILQLAKIELDVQVVQTAEAPRKSFWKRLFG